MKLIFTVFCSLSSLLLFAQHPQITGNIKNLGNDTLLVDYMTFSQRLSFSGKPLRDTIVSKNDSFTYTAPTKEPIIMKIESKRLLEGAGGQSLSSNLFFLMPTADEHLILTGEIDRDHFLTYTVSGSDFNRDLAEMRINTKEQVLESERLQLLLKNKGREDGDEQFKEKLLSDLSKISNQIKQTELDYIKNNPTTELAVFLLCQQPLDTMANYVNTLGKNAKDGRFNDLLHQQIERYDKNIEALSQAGILIGKPAPDFTLKSSEGKDVSLYSIKKDFVLLDFWGSWCTWCINDFPKMKEFYSTYSNKLEILGIACNDKQEAWLASLKKNNLGWMNVINNKENDVAAKYVINTYPTKILLDKEKKIVGIFKGESQDVYKKLEELIR